MYLAGCETMGNSQSYHSKTFRYPETEPSWIKNGEPLEFEGQKWYPVDNIENLLDSEVDFLGSYRDVEIFAEKLDVRPYNQLYTKFGRNKFRVFVLKRDL